MLERPLDARRRLRAAVDADHQRIERRFEACDLTMAGGVAIFLLTHLAAYRSLIAMNDALPGVREALLRNIRMIEDDLGALGAVSADDGPLVAVGGCELGAQYVLIGSQFGKKFLQTQWGAGLPRGFVDDTSLLAYWPPLIRAIEARSAEPASFAQTVESARSMFALFEQCLDQALRSFGRKTAAGA